MQPKARGGQHHARVYHELPSANLLAVVDAGSGAVRPVGAPQLYNGVNGAPDGVHVLTQTLRPPFSHAVTYQRFGYDVDVLDVTTGKRTRIASLPLAERVPVRQ